eukprot:4003370-Pyramimonas_sp.AAC.1
MTGWVWAGVELAGQELRASIVEHCCEFVVVDQHPTSRERRRQPFLTDLWEPNVAERCEPLHGQLPWTVTKIRVWESV